jgi:hypothetical protein
VGKLTPAAARVKSLAYDNSKEFPAPIHFQDKTDVHPKRFEN